MAPPPRFWTLANLLTLSRIPFGIGFWFVADHPGLALAVLVVGGGTDLVDGWVARRAGQAQKGGVGAWLDPLCDKFFVVAMLVALAIVREPPLWVLPAVAAREIVVVPLAGAYALSAGLRRRMSYDFRAGKPGKVATLTQFAALVALLFGSPWIEPLAILAAVVGLIAAGDYVRRGLRAARAGRSMGAGAAGPEVPASPTSGA